MFNLGVASCEWDSLDKARENTQDYDVETLPGGQNNREQLHMTSWSGGLNGRSWVQQNGANHDGLVCLWGEHQCTWWSKMGIHIWIYVLFVSRIAEWIYQADDWIKAILPTEMMHRLSWQRVAMEWWRSCLKFRSLVPFCLYLLCLWGNTQINETVPSYQSSLINIPGLTLNYGLHKLVYKFEIETGENNFNIHNEGSIPIHTTRMKMVCTKRRR